MKRTNLIVLMCLASQLCNAQLTWLNLPDYPGQGRLGVNAISIGNYGYLGMGYDGTSGQDDWYRYDPSNNSWTQMANLPSTQGLWSSVTFVINNLGYVVTGAKSPGASNQNYEYNPSTNTWSVKAPFPGVSRLNAAGFAIGTKGFVGTGYGNNTTLKDFYEYDQPSDTWAIKDSFPGLTRSGACGLSIGNKGYIGMGNNTSSTFNFQDFYEYDPATEVWISRANFTLPYIVEPTEFSSATNGYILCGFYYQYTGITYNPLNMMYKYDQLSDQWSLIGTFCGLPRGYAGGFSIGNDIYIGAGAQRNDGLAAWMINDFWKLSDGLTLMINDEDGKEHSEFIVYPNPTGDIIQIDGLFPNQLPKEIRIYNSTGNLVTTKIVTQPGNKIDISSLSKGLYFAELITDKGLVLDGKFIKQ